MYFYNLNKENLTIAQKIGIIPNTLIKFLTNYLISIGMKIFLIVIIIIANISHYPIFQSREVPIRQGWKSIWQNQC